MKIMAKDMDRHAPSWRRRTHQGAVRREPLAATSTTTTTTTTTPSVEVEETGAVDLERESLLDVARLNAAQSVDDIDRQINRVLVEGNLDKKWVDEAPVADTDYWDDDTHLIEEELDQVDLEHFKDLEEALEDVPKVDPDEEGFEVFRQYADQLIKAGGTITYTYNGSDRYDRKLTMPLPLPTTEGLKRSLAIDSQFKDVTTKDVMGHAWMALGKNPTAGEQKRVELTRHLARTINQLSKKNSVLDSTSFLATFK